MSLPAGRVQLLAQEHMRNLFIVGSQGIPAGYGGLETFTEEVATRLCARGHDVFVTCERARSDRDRPGTYRGVRLLYVDAPVGNLRTFVADRKALLLCGHHAQPGDVVYLLGYGVGPYAAGPVGALQRRGIEFWLNPDGLEWKRPRWSWAVRQYLRFAEGFLLRKADRVICDASAIREHHERAYGLAPETTEVIEYGAPIVREADPNVELRYEQFLRRHGLEKGHYYTYVGRFVPDNSMELMVRGVLDRRARRPLVVLAAEDRTDPFYKRLRRLIDSSDNRQRVILTGGIYDRSLLQAVRLGEFAYFHGHEVGGTNPALVEAMGLGSLIVALDTPFNREVAGDAGMFFKKDFEAFVAALVEIESLTEAEIQTRRRTARARIQQHYNWDRIAGLYSRLLGRPASGSCMVEHSPDVSM